MRPASTPSRSAPCIASTSRKARCSERGYAAVHGHPAQGPHPRAAHPRDADQHDPLFVLLAMVIFHYAFTVKEGADLTYFTGGMLWVTFIFAMLLGLNRSFAQEKDERCLDGLLLCPVDRVIIFLAKTAGNLIFLLLIQVVAVPVFTLFFVERSYVGDLLPFLVVLLLADVT